MRILILKMFECSNESCFDVFQKDNFDMISVRNEINVRYFWEKWIIFERHLANYLRLWWFLGLASFEDKGFSAFWGELWKVFVHIASFTMFVEFKHSLLENTNRSFRLCGRKIIILTSEKWFWNKWAVLRAEFLKSQFEFFVWVAG